MGKDPEELNTPNHPYLSTHTFYVFAVACSLQPHNQTVISTEAAHAFVSSAVEKSASPRKPYPSPKRISSLNP